MKKQNIKFMLKLIKNFCKHNGFNRSEECDSCCINYHICNKKKWDKVRKDLVEYDIKF
jgi:hypothetical protein